jgi:N-acetylmuramoyl-L-alanine amidase
MHDDQQPPYDDHTSDDLPPQDSDNENHNAGDGNAGDGNADNAPSDIFLAMMRRAASRNTDAPNDTSSTRNPTPSASGQNRPRMPQFIEAPADMSADMPQTPSAPASSPAPNSRYSHRMPIYEVPDDVTAVDAQQIQDARLEAQRIQRVKRRRAKRRRQQVSFLGGFFRTVFITLVAAGLVGTIFTWFTEPDFLNRDVVSGLAIAEATQIATAQPSPMPTPNWLRRIGIVAGHRGPENDPGAVCPDGLTEAEINFNVAALVVRELRARGYSVDLLDEFDPRLDAYQAAALLSIHANTCQDFGEFVSGYLVAKAASRPEGGEDTRLAECVGYHYGRATQLQRRFTLTLDMTDYHNFREINTRTPAAILELGFMKDDRDLLTNQQPLLAQGIVEGLLCYLAPDENNQVPPDVLATQQAGLP